MGLSGRKEKQRIGHDPRNLSWADGMYRACVNECSFYLLMFVCLILYNTDANKFGTAYLQKLGWSAGTGLGTTGEGRTSHIKVNQKLDMLGIGAAHQKDPNGIAWKQNKDFENLLRRLNGDSAPPTPVDGFVQAGQETEEDGSEEIAKSGDGSERKEGKKKKEKKDQKRKKTKDEGDEEPVKKKRKSKHDNSSDEDSKTKKAKKEKKEKKSKKDVTESTSAAPSASTRVVSARP